MTRTILAGLCLLLTAPLTQAFELVIQADHEVIPAQDIRAMTLNIAQSVGHQIPDDPQIKVVVTAKARLRRQTQMHLYYHRVQLTKSFAGDPPYPVRAWLPIKGVEHYGVANAGELRKELSDTLTQFFQELRAVDPRTQAP